MTKYTSVRQSTPPSAPMHPHPIWNGIGCLLIIFVPLLSFAIAQFLVQFGLDHNWPIPYQLLGYPVVPSDLFSVGAFVPLLTFIQSQNNLYAVLAFTLVLIVILGAVTSLVDSLLYKIVGPPSLGPLDAPPPQARVKRYKR